MRGKRGGGYGSRGRGGRPRRVGGYGASLPRPCPPPSWANSCSESSIRLPRLRAGVLRWSARPSPRPSGVWPTVSVRREVGRQTWRPPAEAERSVGGCELFSRPRRGVCVVCCVCCSELILGLFLSVPLHTSTLWVLTRQPCSMVHRKALCTGGTEDGLYPHRKCQRRPAPYCTCTLGTPS